MSDRNAEQAGTEQESKGTVSFSVRLTEKQRDLLTRAAELKGWTLTNLLKNAALEKAAFIVNTASPNRVDFRGIAHQVADQIFGTRHARVLDMDGNVVDADVFKRFDGQEDLTHFVYPVEVSPWQSPPEFLTDIRHAARYGGTEFLNLVIDAAEPVATRNQPNLPEPIDPNAL